MYRRTCILATISSLQDHFLQMYTSKARQCRLGYDSSPQCDSFQLGEMVKFFVKRGTLDIHSKLFEPQIRQPFAGSISTLLASLGDCPEYQIDPHHKHCGLRSQFHPAIKLLAVNCGFQGICMRCWRTDKCHYSWLEHPMRREWLSLPEMKVGSTASPVAILPTSSCINFHAPHRRVFTSQRRN